MSARRLFNRKNELAAEKAKAELEAAGVSPTLVAFIVKMVLEFGPGVIKGLLAKFRKEQGAKE